MTVWCKKGQCNFDWFPKFGMVNIQLYWPKFYVKKREWYLEMMTTFRLFFGAPVEKGREGKDYGLGLVILGFGICLVLYKEINNV
jgi:hypothetical protein